MQPALPCRLSLRKQSGHHYIFRYAPGDELTLRSALADLADDPTADFDWFDEAVLACQLSTATPEHPERTPMSIFSRKAKEPPAPLDPSLPLEYQNSFVAP